jgi:hypothetical protein
MLNRQRTLVVFGYDIDPSVRRRTKTEFSIAGALNKKELKVVDNCPECNVERQIKLNQSRKNKPCSKCFHNSPEMLLAKHNQDKVKSPETRQKMRDNHWSKHGMQSGQQHSAVAIAKIKEVRAHQYDGMSEEELKQMYIKSSCTQRGIPLEQFDGFSSPEGTRIRQSAEGKAWTYDVLAKANFTCMRCGVRGGQLHAHHKNAFAAFPEQRMDVENGACLCIQCHDLFHTTYGKGTNTAEQFDMWIQEFRIMHRPS